MAYQALYRKYRPASFDEVVGQKHIVQTLKNAIANQRIAHAYLFCGPRGTGKTSIAKIFARTLNCTGENPPCMECENCKLSLDGTHPDIIEIDAASNNGVDEVRALIERVNYSPMEGKYKIYIIDEVHMMTSGAFNALLKTIEEPPEHVIFIFATTEPHKVLPTILSRCQRYDFSKVSNHDIQQRLIQICEKENVNADEDALEFIATLADGGMRDALSILDQCIAYEQNHITIDAVREIYGVVQPEQLGELVSKLVPEEANQAIEQLKKIESRGMDLKRLCADLISMFKDSLLLGMAKQTELISEHRKEILNKYFMNHPVQKRIQILNDLMNLYNRLAFSSNVMDYMETILLKAALWQAPVQNPIACDVHPNNQIQYEKRSDSSDKSARQVTNSPKVTPKSNLSDLFWKSDVSRETTKMSEKPKSEFTFSEDFLLSLLVAGNKEEKNADMYNMKDLEKYRNDLKYSRFVASLNKFTYIADGKDFMLIGVQSKLDRDFINDMQNSVGYETFTNEILKKPKKIFAITIEDGKNLIEVFKKRSAEKTLPEPAKLELNEVLNVEDLPIEEQLLKRFKDLKIVDD